MTQFGRGERKECFCKGLIEYVAKRQQLMPIFISSIINLWTI